MRCFLKVSVRMLPISPILHTLLNLEYMINILFPAVIRIGNKAGQFEGQTKTKW